MLSKSFEHTMLQTIPDQVVTINKQKLARLKVARKRYVVNVSAAKKNIYIQF